MDAHLDKLARDNEDLEQELNRLYLAQPIEQPPKAIPAATSDTTIKTSDDKPVTEDGSESSRPQQEPLFL